MLCTAHFYVHTHALSSSFLPREGDAIYVEDELPELQRRALSAAAAAAAPMVAARTAAAAATIPPDVAAAAAASV